MAEIHQIDVVVKATDNATKVLDRIINSFGVATKQGLAMGVAFAVINKTVDFVMQSFSNLINYLQTGIQMNREFDLSLARISVSLDDLGIPISDVSNQLRAFSIVFADTLQSLTEGLRSFIREGFSVSESLKMLAQSERLAVVTGENLSDINHAIVTTMEVFDYQTESTGYVVKKINEIISTTGISISDFDNILSRSADAIRNNVISFDDLVNILYTLENQGYNSRSMLLKLKEILDEPAEFKIDILPEETVADIETKFKRITSTSAFTAEQMKKLNELSQMDLSKGIDIGAHFDKTMIEQARISFVNLQDAGVTTLEQFYDYIMKTSDETGFFSGKMLKLVSAMYAYNESIAESETDEFTGEIQRLETALVNLQTKFQNTTSVLQTHGKNLKELRKERSGLVAVHPLEEDLRYMVMGLQDATYASKIHNEATRELINSIRIQREEIDKLNVVNQTYALEQNENTLEIMKIQYSAMDNRRGLTRGQKQIIKELEKANMGLRISTLENQNMVDQKTMDLSPFEQRLDKTKMWYDEEIYIIQDTYNKELLALDEKISLEQKALWDNFNTIKEINNAIYQNELDTYNAIKNLHTGKSTTGTTTTTTTPIVVPKIVEDIRHDPRTRWYFGNYQMGTNYVPRTGLYMLHQGETVIPRDKNKNINSPVNIKVEPITLYNYIYDNFDVEKLAQKIELAVQSGLVKGMTTSYK